MDITIDGVTKSIYAWCKEKGISSSVVYKRIKDGSDPKKALLKATRKYCRLDHIEGQHPQSAKTRQWRKKNRENGLCNCGRPHRKNRYKCQVCADNSVASARKIKFGVDKEHHDQLLKEQNHKCAICETPVDKRSHIDHCHKSKVVRYILCRSCNTFLGNYEKFKGAGLLGKIESYLLMFNPFDISPSKQLQNK
jgi:hypothetical protein